ncbi:MAG: Asr1405/Asl0597 family protein [Microcoleaceae cyanobacterium]
MNSSQLQPEDTNPVEVDATDRWLVYYRLKDLDIPCWCQVGQPLRVRISTPAEAAQLSSVVKQHTASRHELIQNLEKCWLAE